MSDARTCAPPASVDELLARARALSGRTLDELCRTLDHVPSSSVEASRTKGLVGRLVERGDTLVVIEHHPQVMAGADFLIELGPGGGGAGGKIVAAAAPRSVARGKTPTASVLRDAFAEVERPKRARAGLSPS